jgi:hypothetical protein
MINQVGVSHSFPVPVSCSLQVSLPASQPRSRLLRGCPVESLQSHFILTMSHWSCGLPICFPSQGAWVQIPWGVLMFKGEEAHGDFDLHQRILTFGTPLWQFAIFLDQGSRILQKRGLTSPVRKIEGNFCNRVFTSSGTESGIFL